jgi:hypothetical protein
MRVSRAVRALYDTRGRGETVAVASTGLHVGKGFAPLTTFGAGAIVKSR